MNSVKLMDLATCGEKTFSAQCEVCVVGAGAAGIYVAVQLASRGLDVVLLEAGNTNGADALAIGFDARFDADLYPGATAGRFFGMGGSTSRWGGLLIPHTRHDLRNTPAAEFDVWRHIVQTVADKSVTVLDKLGWHSGDDFSTFPRNLFNGD